jgi:hypothetical protein
MLPSIWREAELKVSRPRRRVLLLAPMPDVDVVPELPPLGSALPVIMEADNVPRGGLPAVGSWVKLKVVGLLAVQVGCTGCSKRLVVSITEGLSYSAYCNGSRR